MLRLKTLFTPPVFVRESGNLLGVGVGVHHTGHAVQQRVVLGRHVVAVVVSRHPLFAVRNHLVNTGSVQVVGVQQPRNAPLHVIAVDCRNRLVLGFTDHISEGQYVGGFEGDCQSTQLVQNHPQAPDVCLLVVWLVVHEFRREIKRSANERIQHTSIATHLSAHTQVCNFHRCVLLCKHHVQGFQVAVDNTIDV